MTPSIATLSRPHTLVRIGDCLRLLGRGDEAIAALTEGISLLERLQLFSHGPYAIALESLAAVLADHDRVEESRTAYASAAEAFEAIGDAEAGTRCRDLAAAAR
jgi:tetratricopeptide (TPR) repeat protein